MGYVGNSPTANFASVTKDTFSGDGSTTAFTLSKAATTNGVAVFVENVRQVPTTAYAVSGTTLTFTAAPSSGTNNIFVYFLELAAGTITPTSEFKGNFKNGGMFRTNAQALDTNITILATENAQVTGTLTVNSGITLTINDGGRLVVS